MTQSKEIQVSIAITSLECNQNMQIHLLFSKLAGRN